MLYCLAFSWNLIIGYITASLNEKIQVHTYYNIQDHFLAPCNYFILCFSRTACYFIVTYQQRLRTVSLTVYFPLCDKQIFYPFHYKYNRALYQQYFFFDPI
jgi:hypothetical protein